MSEKEYYIEQFGTSIKKSEVPEKLLSNYDDDNDEILLELISDRSEKSPDSIEGVKIINDNYFVTRWLMKGFLVSVRKRELDQKIFELGEIDYDVYKKN